MFAKMSLLALVLVSGCDQLMARLGNVAAPVPSPLPSPSPSPTELASTTADTAGFATVTGTVQDPKGERLDGAVVVAKVAGKLFANGQAQVTATSQLGTFVLNGCPTGVTLTVSAAKPGYRGVTQTFVPLLNADGDPRANQLHFRDQFALQPL